MAAVSSRASEHPLQTIAAKMKSYDVHRSVRVVEKCSFNVHVSAGWSNLNWLAENAARRAQVLTLVEGHSLC